MKMRSFFVLISLVALAAVSALASTGSQTDDVQGLKFRFNKALKQTAEDQPTAPIQVAQLEEQPVETTDDAPPPDSEQVPATETEPPTEAEPTEDDIRAKRLEAVMADPDWQMDWEKFGEDRGWLEIAEPAQEGGDSNLTLPGRFDLAFLHEYVHEEKIQWFRIAFHSSETGWSIICLYRPTKPTIIVRGHYNYGQKPSYMQVLLVGPPLDGKPIIYEVVEGPEELFVIKDSTDLERARGGHFRKMNLVPLSHDSLPNLTIGLGKFVAVELQVEIPSPE